MKIIVIADPDLFEIQEMLDAVAESHDLDDILPSKEVLAKHNMTQAEFCKAGWCYLWYDHDTLKPIGYTLFSFENIDFTDFSFITTDQSLFSVREKEKQWVEKQYYIYSDEYLKPFALYYISFRYNISGRYKE